jgi:hypothetical protein
MYVKGFDSTSSNNALVVANSSGNIAVFRNDGNVGVGTSTPIDDGRLSVYNNANNYATFGGPRPLIVGGHSQNYLGINGGNLGSSALSGQVSSNLVYGANIYTARVSVDGFGLIFSKNVSDYMFKSFNSADVNKFTINHAGYVDNRLGVGVDPTAKIHAGAGTAAANTAPLKFTAGTNMTTPENGAFEFDGTNLYFTVGGVRKTVTLI